MTVTRRVVALDAAEARRARAHIARWLRRVEERAGGPRAGEERSVFACEIHPALSLTCARALTAATERALARVPGHYLRERFPYLVVAARGRGRELARIEIEGRREPVIYIYPLALRAWSAGRADALLPGLRASLLAKALAHEVGHDLYARLSPARRRAWVQLHRAGRRTGLALAGSDAAETFANAEAYELLRPGHLGKLDANLAAFVAQANRGWGFTDG